MGDDEKMSDKEFRARMRRATQTPGERLQDWFIMLLAKIGGIAILIWLVTHLDQVAAWLNGK